MNSATLRITLPLIFVTALAAWAAESNADRTVHRSSDFGWKANQDVTESFAKLLRDGTLTAGDELVLDHTYRINIMSRTGRALPDNFALSAAKGAGFDVYGLSQDVNPPHPVLELGDRTTLRNLTIICEGVPTKILAPARQAKYFRGTVILANNKDDILIENCRLSGLAAHNIVLKDCRRPKIIGCHIVGGYWSVVLGASDAIIWRCLFEKSTCDSIKTSHVAGRPCRGIVVENCVFQDNPHGDGIDTTGGFNDSVVRNCIFRRLGVSGLDLKSYYEKRLGGPENIGILVERCVFFDTPNAIVLTTLDGDLRKGEKALLTADNMKQYAPHDIDINDCAFGHVEKPLRPSKDGGYGVDYPKEGEHMRMILMKDAHKVNYRDARLYGDRIVPVYTRSGGGSKGLSKEAADAIDRTVTGNILDEPAQPLKPGDTTVPFTYGPQPLDG